MEKNIKIALVENFTNSLKDFYQTEWPSANEEVFGFREQARWKMEEFIYTALLNEEIVGVLQFRLIGGVGYLSTILVKEEYRGKGLIGQTLLQHFEKICKDKGNHKLALKSYKEKRATNFFLKNGYQIEGILENDIHGIDWVYMAKFI